MNKTNPKGQNFTLNIIYIITGILFVFALVDGFSSALEFITVTKAIIGTVVIIISIVILLLFPSFQWKLAGGQQVKVIKFGKKIYYPLLGALIAIWIPPTLNFFYPEMEVETPIIQKVFNPIFYPNDSTSFNILIIRFEDYIADKDTYCIGRSIQENLNIAIANDTTSNNLRVEYVSDSIPPPKSVNKAIEIQEKHNADLIIYGLARNLDIGCLAEVCFKYNINEDISSKLSPAIVLKKAKFDSEYLTTSAEKIEAEGLSIDTQAMSDWVVLLAKIKAGQDDESFIHMDKYITSSKTDEQKAERYMIIGNTYASMNEQPKAINAYNSALDISKNDIQTLANRAGTYFNNGEIEKAKKDLDYVLKHGTDYNGWLNSARAKIAIHLNNPKEALLYYNKAILIDSTIGEFFQNRGGQLAHLNRYNEAISDYKKVIQLKAESSYMAYANLGYVHDLMSKHDLALAYNDTAVRLKPKFFESYVNRANSYRAKKMVYKAMDDYDKAIVLNPNDPRAYYSCGYMMLTQMGDIEQAVLEFDKAISVDSTMYLAYMQRGVAYSELQNFKKSIKDLNTALRINTDNPDIYFWRGRTYMEMKNHNLAIKDYNSYLNTNPKDEKKLGVVAQYVFTLGQKKLAYKLFLLSKKYSEGSSYPHYNLGRYYSWVGNFKKAKEYFFNAHKLNWHFEDFTTDTSLESFFNSREGFETLEKLKAN